MSGLLPNQSSPAFTASAEVLVIVGEGATELRLPNVSEPVVLRPGESRRIAIATAMEVDGA